MSTATKSFFANQQNAQTVRNFSSFLHALQPLEPPNPEIVRPLATFFGVLSQNLSAFDERCTENISWLGERYIGQLIAFMQQNSEKSNEQLIDIFTISYRFLCELEFSQPDSLSMELRSIQTFVEQNLELFHGTHRQQLVYANYTMPASIAKRIIHHSALSDFKAFAETANSAQEMKEQWDKEIAVKHAETQGLQDSINRMQSKYNFVGLVNGFALLADKKQAESRNAFISLLCLGFVMILPVCIQLGFVLWNVGTIESHRATLAYSLPPLLTLELILLYFFRVVLANHRDLKAQLLQLDLRISLCQFIQSYSEYSTKIKKNDSSALDRFESIIFSAVTSDAEKMPATFDGLDQLGKLVSSIRSK
jgi:hypothetical protein